MKTRDRLKLLTLLHLRRRASFLPFKESEEVEKRSREGVERAREEAMEEDL
jgi:hypothetical protein